MTTGRWAYGLADDDDFTPCADRETAIREGLSNFEEFGEPLRGYYCIAPVIEKPEWAHLIQIDGTAVIDQVFEFANDEGELPEDCDWLQNHPEDLIKDLESLLNTAMELWVIKHELEPTWWTIGEIERIY